MDRKLHSGLYFEVVTYRSNDVLIRHQHHRWLWPEFLRFPCPKMGVGPVADNICELTAFKTKR
jgi:hypothetical protein